MQSGIESLVKLVLVALLILAGLAMWLAPKTRLFRQRRISERAFVATCVIGILCGAVGLAVTFLWPRQVLEWHIWEAMVMPLTLAYCYWLLVRRNARTFGHSGREAEPRHDIRRSAEFRHLDPGHVRGIDLA